MVKEQAHTLGADITHPTCDYIGSCGTEYLTIAICSICKVCSNNTCGVCLLLFGFHFTFHSSSVFLTSVRPRPVDLKLVELVSPELRLGLGMLEQNSHGRHASNKKQKTVPIYVLYQWCGSSEPQSTVLLSKCMRIAAQLQ